MWFALATKLNIEFHFTKLWSLICILHHWLMILIAVVVFVCNFQIKFHSVWFIWKLFQSCINRLRWLRNEIRKIYIEFIWWKLQNVMFWFSKQIKSNPNRSIALNYDWIAFATHIKWSTITNITKQTRFGITHENQSTYTKFSRHDINWHWLKMAEMKPLSSPCRTQFWWWQR